MDLHLHTRLHEFFTRFWSRKSGLSRNPESRRRLHAAVTMMVALLLGGISSQSLRKNAIHDYRLQNRPTRDQATLWMEHNGWARADESLSPHLPPMDPPVAWWIENEGARIWYVESPAQIHLFQSQAYRPPSKADTPRFELAGRGWEAVPRLLEALQKGLKSARDSAPRVRQARLISASSHPKEWRF